MQVREKDSKTKAILRSLFLSVVMMVFPVASGVIVTINNIASPPSY